MSISDATKNFDFLAIVGSSLVLIVSIAWNNLIQASINKSFPEKDKSLTAQTLYTISLTIAVGVFTNYMFVYRDKVSGLVKKVLALSAMRI